MSTRLAVPLLCGLLLALLPGPAYAQAGDGQGPPARPFRVWRATRKFQDVLYPPNGAQPLRIQGERAYDLVLLRGPESLWSGTVWLVVHAQPGHTASDGGLPQLVADAIPYQAYRGAYHAFRHPTDPDVVVFSVGFTRKYQVGALVAGYRYHRGAHTPPDNLEWNLDVRFQPSGAALDVPAPGLVDQAGSFAPKWMLTPTRAFFVDGTGRETVLRHEPYTLGEKIFGGPVRALRTLDYLPVGATLRFAEIDAARDALWKSPPPAFRP